jgi:oligoribonuclease (3'-5' exoribonuclease)
LETSGLNPQTDQILMVGAVVEDTEHPEIPVEQLPHFACYIKYDRYHGSDYALSLNAWILRITSGRSNNEPEHPIYEGWRNDKCGMEQGWVSYFNDFLDRYFAPEEKILLAGKNVASFDYQFLPNSLKERFAYHFIDPGSVFIDWKVGIQSLGKLKERLGLGEEVTHDALEDARDVIKVLRKSYPRTEVIE